MAAAPVLTAHFYTLHISCKWAFAEPLINSQQPIDVGYQRGACEYIQLAPARHINSFILPQAAGEEKKGLFFFFFFPPRQFVTTPEKAGVVIFRRLGSHRKNLHGNVFGVTLPDEKVNKFENNIHLGERRISINAQS